MRPLTHALPGALAQLLRDTPLSDGKVGFAWRAAVGPAVERATKVEWVVDLWPRGYLQPPDVMPVEKWVKED